MKLLTVLAASLMLGTPALSQSSATSSGQATVNATTNIDGRTFVDGRTLFESGGESTVTSRTTVDGTQELKNVPQVTAPSMGSGHPCGLGNSLGIAIVGGGATGGSTRSDDACLLAQMGHTQAATVMIAARNKDACRALVATGRISPNSYCGSGRRSASVSNNAPQAVGPAVANNPATQQLAPATSPRPSSQPIVSSMSPNRSIPRGSVICGEPIRVKSWARDEVSNATAIAFCSQ